MANYASRHRVCEVPELLSFICRYSSLRTQVRMLQVSHSFFDIVAPIVWERVEGVHHLLKLLPGVTAVESIRPTRDGFIIITLPTVLEDNHFDRFDLYARFVKYLEIYPGTPFPKTNGYSFKGWPRFLNHVRNRTLLPNLLELNLTIRSSPSSNEQFLWIRAFLSPSLSAIRVQTVLDVFNLPTINPLVAIALLGHIASTCPNLRVLWLFPVKPQTEPKHEDDYAAAMIWEPPGSYYNRLPALQLRELECPVDILAPDVIDILGHLSTLEHLKVYCIPTRKGPATIAPSPPRLGPLPTLRHFAIQSASRPTMFRILRLNIFTELTSLRLYLGRDNVDEIDSDDSDNGQWVTELVTLISSGSPALSTLELDFDPDAEFSLTSISIIRPLSALPLRTICLKGIAHPLGLALEDLHVVFPAATKLEIPELQFDLVELQHFSKFPHLEHLVVGLMIESFPPTSHPTPTVAPNLRILEATNSVDISINLSPLARYLLSIWPNLEKVLWLEYHVLDANPLQLRLQCTDSVLANALNTMLEIYRVDVKSARPA